MKRIVALFLCAALLCAFSGCSLSFPLGDGKTETQPHDVQPPKEESTEAATDTAGLSADIVDFQELLAKYMDLSHYGDPQVKDGDTRECSYSLKTEFRSDYDSWGPATGYITVGGDTRIQKGTTTVSDLLDKGWAFANQSLETSQLGVNRFVTSPEFTKKDRSIRISIINKTDKIIELKDGAISSLFLDQYSFVADGSKRYTRLDTATDFDIDGKINQDSSLSDLIAAFGDPTEVRYFSDANRAYIAVNFDSLNMTVSADGNTIYSLSWYGVN